jgi:hypothetical protein
VVVEAFSASTDKAFTLPSTADLVSRHLSTLRTLESVYGNRIVSRAKSAVSGIVFKTCRGIYSETDGSVQPRKSAASPPPASPGGAGVKKRRTKTTSFRQASLAYGFLRMEMGSSQKGEQRPFLLFRRSD